MWYKLLLCSGLTFALVSCKPSFKSPEQCAEAIFVSLAHEDDDYLKAITINLDELTEIYDKLDFDGLDKAEVLATATLEIQEMLPGAMDNFKQGASDLKINLGSTEVSSVDIELEGDESIFTGTEFPLQKAAVWIYDDYESYVLIIHNIARVGNRWVLTYPEFEWMTYDDYYESEYEVEEAYEDDYY